MHPTNCVPRPRFWCLVVALGVIGIAVTGQVKAQPPVIPAGMIVPINVTKEIQIPSGKRIKTHAVEKGGLIDITYSKDLKSLFATGVIPGVTNLTIVDEDNNMMQLRIFVQADVEFLRQAIKLAVPTANVEPVAVGKDTFILTGTVSRAEDIPAVLGAAESLVPKTINALRIGGVMQVQLDVLIAQVSRSELREMSFSWFAAGDDFFISSVLAPQTATSRGLISAANVTGNLAGTSNLLFGFVNDSNSFFGFLQALRNENLAKFMACPKLVTLSGKPATFLSGGKLAVPEPSGLGTNAVRFQDFGTQLNFLPIVLGNGKIFLEVEPIVDNIDATLGTTINGTSVPGFTSQRLHASVEMEPGQTFAIGGLIQHSVNATTSKVPVLGDLPFLGTAFRTVSHNQVETELLILVTPYLVDAMACNQLPKMVPGQETRIPDDFELFLEGIIEAPRGQRQVFHGNQYRAAYLNGPTANVFPCGVGGYGAYGACGANGNCGTGGCTTGNCGSNGHYQPAPIPSAQPPLAVPGGHPPTLPAGYMNETSQGGLGNLPTTSGHDGTGNYGSNFNSTPASYASGGIGN